MQPSATQHEAHRPGALLMGPLCNATVTQPPSLLGQGLERGSCVHTLMLSLGLCVVMTGCMSV